MEIEMEKARGFVGRTADGDRLWLEIELTDKHVGGHFNSTIGHASVHDFVELTISGSGLYRGRRVPARDIDFGGQCVDTLRKVTRPASGWTVAELRTLADVWDRWHLNGMRAGCAHQDVVMETDRYGREVPSLKLTPPCPVTGYRYGHAWLVDTLPADVVATVRTYMERLDGTDPMGRYA